MASASESGGRQPSPLKAALTRGEWGLILVLAAVQFTHIVDFVIIMPLGDPLMQAYHITPAEFSKVVSAYGLAAAIASILASTVVDRFDRKAVILAMYAGFAASTFLCGLAPTYPWLIAARTLAGTFGGVAAVAVMAVIGDVFPPEKRGRATGAIMSAFAVASIVGLPIGLALANKLGIGAPFTTLAWVCGAVWVLVWFQLPSLTGHIAATQRTPLAEFAAVMRESTHLRAFAFTFSLVLATFTVIPFLGPYMTANVGRAKEDLPIVYAVAGGCTLVSMNVLGYLSDRFGKRLLFRVMASLALVATLLVTNLPPVPLAAAVATASFFMVCASGRMVPAQALIIGCANPRMRGAFMSLNTAVQHLATGVAPLIGGAIMDRAEDAAAAAPLEGYPVVGMVAAGFAVTSLVLSGFIRPAAVEAKPEPASVRVEEAEPEPVGV